METMKTRTSRCLWGMCLGTFLGVSSLFAQNENAVYQPAPENLQAREVFKDNKFGIFLSAGLSLTRASNS